MTFLTDDRPKLKRSLFKTDFTDTEDRFRYCTNIFRTSLISNHARRQGTAKTRRGRSLRGYK